MPAIVKYDVMGFRNLAGQFRKATEAAIRELEAEARDIGQDAAAAIRAEAPQGETGALRRGIRFRVNLSGRTVRITVYSSAKHTKYVLDGHGEIRPVRAKALRFRPRGADSFIYRTRVKAVPPNPFDERGLAKVDFEMRARRIARRYENLLTR